MTTMASQITSLTVVYSIVYSGVDQGKHQSSASLAFVRGIHRIWKLEWYSIVHSVAVPCSFPGSFGNYPGLVRMTDNKLQWKPVHVAFTIELIHDMCSGVVNILIYTFLFIGYPFWIGIPVGPAPWRGRSCCDRCPGWSGRRTAEGICCLETRNKSLCEWHRWFCKK